jgi:hypothetical protein
MGKWLMRGNVSDRVRVEKPLRVIQICPQCLTKFFGETGSDPLYFKELVSVIKPECLAAAKTCRSPK